MSRSPLSGTTQALRQAFSWINLLTPGLLLVGAYGAVLEWRPAAYLMVAALTLSVRPHVQALTDDDDW